MRREAGTAPSHARRNRTNKTSSAGKLYGKSFTTDESVLDRLVAGRAVAPRRSKRHQFVGGGNDNNNAQETKLSSLDRLVAGKSTYTRGSGSSSYSRYDNKGINDHTTSRRSAYNRYDNRGINDHTTRRPANYSRQSSRRSRRYGNDSDDDGNNNKSNKSNKKPVDIPIRNNRSSSSRNGTNSLSTKSSRMKRSSPKIESSFDRLTAGRGPPRKSGLGSRYSTSRSSNSKSSKSSNSIMSGSSSSSSNKSKKNMLGKSKSSASISKNTNKTNISNSSSSSSIRARRNGSNRGDDEQKKKSTLKRNLSIDPSALSKMQEIDLSSPKSSNLSVSSKISLTSPMSTGGGTSSSKSRPHSPYLKYTRPPGRRRSSDGANNKEDSIKLEGIRPSRVKNGWGSKSPELVIDDEITIDSTLDYKIVTSPKSLKSNGRSRKTSPILKVGMTSGEIQSSPVKMVQKASRSNLSVKDIPVRAKSLGSNISKSSNSGGGSKKKSKNTVGGSGSKKDDISDKKPSVKLKKGQKESYNNRPQSRRSRQRPHSGTRMDLKRSNNRAPMFDVAFDLADDNSKGSKSRGGAKSRFVAPPTAWGFST